MINTAKIKKTAQETLARLKRNFKGNQLTEGQKYIRGVKKSNRFTGGKKRSGSFGTAENKLFKEPRTRSLIGIGPGFIGYAIFFVFALVFTQALKSPVSAMLMAFAIMWLFVTVTYLIIMFSSIDSFIDHKGTDVYKLTETDFMVRLVNHSFLPAPFLEADLRVPEKSSLRCIRKRVKVAIHPSGDYTINRRVSFGYRGTYDVGVDTVTVYDFFRIFRVNIRMYNYRSIYVMPRRFALKKRPAAAVSDSQTEVQKNIFGVERSDVAEIRAYLPGDQMKNIHWKLSSKTEELQVKHYTMNSGKTVYLFCDMKAHFDPQRDSSYAVDINEYAVDGVVELAVAAASREIMEGNTCVIAWHDARAEGEVQMHACHDSEDFQNVLKTFSTAPVYRGSGSFTELIGLITESQNVSLVFVTDNLDGEVVSAVTRAAVIYGNSGSAGSAAEVYYFNPGAKINEPTIREMNDSLVVRCREALAEQNVELIETTAELSGQQIV